MKPLLRKLFFWDAPAQGAFFGLTLLPTLVWFAFSFWCGIMVFNYATILNDAVCLALFFTSLAILAYIGFLLGRMLVVACLKTRFRWCRLGVALFFLALSLGYAVLCCFHRFQDGNDWKWVASAMLFVHCIILLFPIIFTSWEAFLGALSCFGGFNAFWTLFAFAYEPFRSGGLREMSLTHWIRELIPFIDAFHQWFRLDKPAGCVCFVLVVILLQTTGYLLFGSLLADYAKIPLRKLFSRKTRCVLGIVAGSYVVFLSLAIWENASYHRAIKELETHFGHPLTAAELERQFYADRPANPEFWKQLETVLNEYYESQTEEERELLDHLDAIIPEDIHIRCKKRFLENTARRKLEQMLTSPIPPPKRNYADDQMLAGTLTPELSTFRELAKMGRQRIIYALEDGDFGTVSAALDTMDACREDPWKDHLSVSYLVGIAVETFRLKAMEKILASGLPTDEWLKAQSAKLVEIERQVEEREEHFVYGEAVSCLNVFHWMAYYAGAQDVHRGLHFHSLRFFFPQGWWLAANEVQGMANALRVHSFSEMPDKRTGYAVVDMMLPGCFNISVRKKSIIASCRIMRALIQAELHKRRTGEYPDSLDDLPLDPFSGEPLQYRKGACQVVEEVYQKKEEEYVNEDTNELYNVSEIDFKEREREVDAVQVWSVGPNCINDGGAPGEKRNDDIRLIIPMK
ncbi:MAG: hypothetical protein IKZ46_13875 [Victivallales bacterium]|nr:hypothetical protein [Victivallales bacterium]